MTLAQIKARDAAWKKAYDALIDETDATVGDVTEAQSAQFGELHEEAETIIADYKKLGTAEARQAADGFEFLFRNAANVGRGPKHIIALCEAAIA